MTKKEIVWVYGASAAGKETFIRSVTDSNTPLLQQFSWQDKRIGVCEQSIEWVAQYPGDLEGRHKRSELSQIIISLAEKYDVVLVKGQDEDLSLGTPLHVRHALPDFVHHIIYIDVGLDELYERVIHKPWWNELTKRAEEEGWLEEQIDRLTEIKNQFQFTTINGRQIGHYEEEVFTGNFV